MKRIIASAGLVAIGATGLNAQNTPGLSRMETTKPWSVSAALRAFYDDNYFAQISEFEEDSFGFEVRPRIAVNLLPSEQTYIGGAYTYALKWYEARADDEFDQSHEVDLKLDHRFSERLRVAFTDSFVYAREPEVVEGGNGGTITTFRTESDVLRNRASVDLRAQLTETMGLGAGYENGWYDYQDSGDGSRSALLDRLEHTFDLNARWQPRSDLVGLVGYQLGIVDYTGDELLNFYPTPPGPPADALTGKDRNSISHYGYVGGEYTVSEELSVAARAGLQYIDYTEVDEDDLGPYADVSGRYQYVPGSYLQVGVRHERNATDVAGFGTASDVTLDQETTTLYGSVYHRLTARIAASLIAQYQRAVFNGGSFDGDLENFLLAGINLQYNINEHWAADFGYNFDRLDSDDADGRSFTRNRIYAGVRVQY